MKRGQYVVEDAINEMETDVIRKFGFEHYVTIQFFQFCEDRQHTLKEISAEWKRLMA